MSILTENFKQFVHNFKEGREEFFMFVQSSNYTVEIQNTEALT